MRFTRTSVGALIGTLIFLGFAACSQTAEVTGLEGYGQLSGKVTGSEPGVLPVVYAYNMEKDVAYTVFVVDGKYRATNLIPGPYDVTIRAAVDQLEGFDPVTVQLVVTADAHFEADFALENVGLRPNYITSLPAEPCTANRPSPEIAAEIDYALKHGGIEPGKAIGDCADSQILPFDEIFPAGEGRDILFRTCMGCRDRQAGWARLLTLKRSSCHRRIAISSSTIWPTISAWTHLRDWWSYAENPNSTSQRWRRRNSSNTSGKRLRTLKSTRTGRGPIVQILTVMAMSG